MSRREKKAVHAVKLTVNARKNIFVALMCVYPLAQFLVFYVLMNGSNILMAFQHMDTLGTRTWAGFDNFTTLFSTLDGKLFLSSLKNCMIMGLVTTVIGFPLNIIFSYFLYKKRAFSGAIRVIVMLPTMVSGIVMTMLFMKFVETALPQIADEWFGKVLPNLIRNNDTAFGVQIFYTLWLGFSSSLIIYSNAMAAIDDSIMEAARMDGITPTGELLRIVVPLIFPTISTYMITGFAGMLTMQGALFLFYGLNGVPEGAYLAGYYMFQIAKAGEATRFPIASAASLVITFLSVPLTLTVQWIMGRLDPMRVENGGASHGKKQSV